MNSSFPNKLSKYVAVIILVLGMSSLNADFADDLSSFETSVPTENPFKEGAEGVIDQVTKLKEPISGYFARLNKVTQANTGAESVDAQSISVPTETSVATANPAEEIVAAVSAKNARFEWLNKKNAVRFGAGAIALMAFGGVVYVLYENGTLKKITDAAKSHPRIAAGGITTTIAGVVGVLLYTNKIAVPSIKLPEICVLNLNY
jgi:hypothetical protein